MRKLFLALLIVALMALPAFASVQNLKISGSINSTMLYRENFDFGLSNDNDEKQNIFMTHTKLRADADLTDNVSATVQIANERPWGDNLENASTNNGFSDVQLHLAYVTLREMLYSPLTVVVGRQEFSYGNAFIVSTKALTHVDSPLYNVAADFRKFRAADAIRAILDYKPLSIELLYTKLDENTATLIQDPAGNDDCDLYGVNIGYDLGDDMKTKVETYFFAKIDKSTGKPAAGDASKNDTIYTPGVRVSTNPLEGLNLGLEYAHQSGTKSGTADTNQQSRDANAIQFISAYALPDSVLPGKVKEYKPVLGYEFTYVSGDANQATVDSNNGVSQEVWEAWDPMYEGQAGGKIYNALFDQTNSYTHSVYLTANPMEDLMTKLTFSKLYLAKELHPSVASAFTINQPDSWGTDATVGASWDKRGLGWELDFDATYDYTEDVKFGLSLGWFEPGSVFDKENNGDAAKQALVNVNVNF